MGYPGTTRRGLGRPLLIGTLLALATVAAVAVWAVAGGGLQRSTADENDVLVVLVLPDEEGTVIPRTVTRVTAAGASGPSGPAVAHADPRTPATIPGTTYDELRDAYPFGGGSLLVRTLTETTATADAATAPGGAGSGASTAPPAYVIVDLDALRTLAAGRDAALTLDLPDHMEVFDGERLYSFAEGPLTVALDELPALFAGAEYLSPQDRESVRVQVAATLLALLRDNAAAGNEAVTTDLSAEQYSAFTRELPID